MPTLSGGQAAVETLKAENVIHVFGLIGPARTNLETGLSL